MKKKMSTKFYLSASVIFQILLLVGCKSKEAKIQPEINTITESVYASVTIQPENLYSVYSSVNGILDVLYIDEGSTVKIGDKLFQIHNNNPTLNAEKAKLAYQLAIEDYKGKDAVLISLQKEISAAKLKLELDSSNFFRQKNLWQQNIGSKADYDAKKLAYELTKNNLALLKNNYSQSSNNLSNNVSQAEINYQSALLLASDYTIKAVEEGKVYAINKKAGENVTTMEALAEIGSSNSFIIEMLVDEMDITKIQTGFTVLIELEAYKGEIYTATIRKIYPQKDIRNQTFTLEAVFKESPKVLYPGLSGEANIIIQKKENALIIPKAYLINENFVQTDNGLIEIKKGIETTEFIEVLSGITQDDWIYKMAK
jgi:HlyD family secretion protein